MRVGIAAEGTRGDVAPMLELGAALARDGHRVAFACAPGFREVVERRGMRFCAPSSDVHAFVAANARAIARGGLRAALAFDRFARESLAAQIDASLALAAESDVMIGAGVQLAAASAAEHARIPYRYVFFCPVMLPSPEHAPFLLPFASGPAWLNRALWRLFLPPFRLSIARAIAPHRRRLGLPPAGDVLRLLLTDAPILAADPALAPLGAHLAHTVERIDRIAALHAFDTSVPLPEKLERFLEAGEPPVYIGFGSMSDPDPAATTRTLLDAVERAGCRALISTGWAGLGDGALPSHVERVGSLPHAALFPRCAAIVHHGGAGTTTTAARAGTPQVVVPHIADQFWWAHAARARGVAGPAVSRARLDADRLATALRGVLDNEWMAERARQLAARMHADLVALGPPARVLGLGSA
ncbi:MAG: glycosyltransferase [Myxococcota bacterium]